MTTAEFDAHVLETVQAEAFTYAIRQRSRALEARRQLQPGDSPVYCQGIERAADRAEAARCRPVNVATLTQRVGGTSEHRVRRALTRLERAGKVVRIEGGWGERAARWADAGQLAMQDLCERQDRAAALEAAKPMGNRLLTAHLRMEALMVLAREVSDRLDRCDDIVELVDLSKIIAEAADTLERGVRD